MKAMISNRALNNKLQKVSLFVTDFDGVHTNGLVVVNQDGVESVSCSRKDGLGVLMLKRHQIEFVVISKETNRVVLERCNKIGARCFHKVSDSTGKLEILRRLVDESGLAAENVLYMGDDVNDRACLEFAGVAVTVADGHKSLLSICDYVTKGRGGEHVIREVVEMLLQAKGYAIVY